MKRFLAVFFVLTTILITQGCGKKFPDGFPKVYPINITITDGGTPLSSVKISFLTNTASFAVSGETDASGVPKIVTAQGEFSAEGIPAGDYVVTLQDVMKIDIGVSAAEIAAMSRSEQGKLEEKRQKLISAYKKKVPDSLCKSGGKIDTRSPIRFTASEGPNELKIDVSEYKK